MPEAYGLEEAVFIQDTFKASAANADTLNADTVPAGKIWTILSAGYQPSVNETQTVYFYIRSRSTAEYPVTEPLSVALGPAIPWPVLPWGLELKLFPGESLGAARSAHTAGSQMYLRTRYIESDMPLYHYEEPQVVKREKLARSSLLQRIGGVGRRGGGGGAPFGTGPRPPGGGGGRPPAG